jgi:hypothetical protein
MTRRLDGRVSIVTGGGMQLAMPIARLPGVSSRANKPRPYRDVFDPDVAADFS